MLPGSPESERKLTVGGKKEENLPLVERKITGVGGWVFGWRVIEWNEIRVPQTLYLIDSITFDAAANPLKPHARA